MPLHDVLRDLDLLVRSRYSILVLETGDMERAETLLRELASRMDLPLFAWSVTRGIRRAGSAEAVEAPGAAAAPSDSAPPRGERRTRGGDLVRGADQFALDTFRRTAEAEATPYDTTHPIQALHHVEIAGTSALYHFRGLEAHLGEPAVAAKLREAAKALKAATGALVLTGTGVELPHALRPMSATVRVPLPRPSEYRAVLREVVTELSAKRPLRVELAPDDVTALTGALRGMTLSEARKVLTRAILEDGVLSPGDIPRLLRAKAESVARDGMLEFIPAEEGMEGVAGLAGLKQWLARRRVVLTDPRRAAEFGLRFPRGILLMGVPGTGKSLSARTVAAEWRLPLLRFDPGSLYDRYLGESEKNFRRALSTAETLEPAVLWIDEIEKAFTQSDQDGGVSTRVLGGFLSWLQDHTAELFVVATANDVTRVPPELLRKGRFDEIFFVDLPGAEDRAAILALHLRRRRMDPADFEVDALARDAEGFSGAELEQAVVAALYAALAEGSGLTTELLREEIGRTHPLSRTRAEEIGRLRAWAQGRAVPAG